MATLVQFGAGNIGRSFVAQLFARAGYRVVFVDVVDELVSLLNARGRYRVMIKDREPAEMWVDGVSAVNGKDIEAVGKTLAEADIAATSVGSNALPYLFPAIARGLQLRLARGRGPLDIILAENLRNAATFVRDGLRRLLPDDFPLDAMVGLVETSIGKMVPIMTDAQRREDPLWVFAEAYNTLILDAQAFQNPIPQVPGLSPKDNIAAYVDRKLFIHNLGHAAVSYLGYLEDSALTYLWEAMERPPVRDGARAAMQESARALLAAYPGEFTPAALQEHIDDLLRRFTNQALGDTIFRVGRDLPRKLSREDRVIGAMLFDRAHGIDFSATARIAAAALEFRGTDEHGRLAPTDAAFVDTHTPRGIAHILSDVCGLQFDRPEEREIAEAVERAHAALR
ncbi:MAG TPA: mannitol-1-phosphate 5-dehydrogenase [Armatimonadota bacterium]|jgi:mannitol-1-phosphate 5-dehydrogenase